MVESTYSRLLFFTRQCAGLHKFLSQKVPISKSAPVSGVGYIHCLFCPNVLFWLLDVFFRYVCGRPFSQKCCRPNEKKCLSSLSNKLRYFMNTWPKPAYVLSGQDKVLGVRHILCNRGLGRVSWDPKKWLRMLRYVICARPLGVFSPQFKFALTKKSPSLHLFLTM